MNDLERIVALLADPSMEKRIAGAIVLGELKAKSAEAIDALADLAQAKDLPVLQRHALEALGKIGAKRAVPKLFGLLSAPSEEVRRAASHAIASVGEEVVAQIRGRIASAEGEERRALDSILAELGGKDAFSALLSGLSSSNAETTRAAAIAVRQQVKGADARVRKGYLSETERFLAKQHKNGAQPGTIAAAVKILGYLEDEKAIDTLLEHAGPEQPTEVRQEAIIGLRFALQKKQQAPAVVGRLIEAASAEDRALAQTALHTMGALSLSAAQAKKLETLLQHPEIERARLVIEQLGRQKDGDAAKILVSVVSGGEKKRAEMAASALIGNDEAAPLLAKALLDCEDVDRSWLIRKILHPLARTLSPALRKQLLATALERLAAHEKGWEAPLEIAREADPDSAGDALRELAAKFRRSKDKDKAVPVLSILAKSGLGAPEDTYALASLELAKGAKDVRPAARAHDEALKLLGGLVKQGFDIGAALSKDRSLELDALYYVGFHFLEEGHPVGTDLLEDVVKKGGRTKLAKMAKNKLALAEA